MPAFCRNSVNVTDLSKQLPLILRTKKSALYVASMRLRKGRLQLCVFDARSVAILLCHLHFCLQPVNWYKRVHALNTHCSDLLIVCTCWCVSVWNLWGLCNSFNEANESWCFYVGCRGRWRRFSAWFHSSLCCWLTVEGTKHYFQVYAAHCKHRLCINKVWCKESLQLRCFSHLSETAK